MTVSLEVVKVFQFHCSDEEVEGPSQQIAADEDYAEDEGVSAILLIEHYDPLHVEQEGTHQQQGHDYLEDCDEE